MEEETGEDEEEIPDKEVEQKILNKVLRESADPLPFCGGKAWQGEEGQEEDEEDDDEEEKEEKKKSGIVLKGGDLKKKKTMKLAQTSMSDEENLFKSICVGDMK